MGHDSCDNNEGSQHHSKQKSEATTRASERANEAEPEQAAPASRLSAHDRMAFSDNRIGAHSLCACLLSLCAPRPRQFASCRSCMQSDSKSRLPTTRGKDRSRGLMRPRMRSTRYGSTAAADEAGLALLREQSEPAFSSRSLCRRAAASSRRSQCEADLQCGQRWNAILTRKGQWSGDA